MWKQIVDLVGVLQGVQWNQKELGSEKYFAGRFLVTARFQVPHRRQGITSMVGTDQLKQK